MPLTLCSAAAGALLQPWLAEQCWERKLPHDGLKDDLVARLLAWQASSEGHVAAQDAVSAARTALAAAGAAVAAATGAAFAPSVPNRAAVQVTSAAGEATTTATVKQPNPPMSQKQVPAAVPQHKQQQHMASGAASSKGAHATDARGLLNTTASVSTGSSMGGMGVPSSAVAAQLHPPPPVSAAAAAQAAAAALDALLLQLRDAPDSPAVAALARNALEAAARRLEADKALAAADTPVPLLDVAQPAQQLAAVVVAASSPRSVAVLARACYAREMLSPLLAAAMADAVSAVAHQLEPTEVYGVLRLLAEHRGGDASDMPPDGNRNALERAFLQLAESLLRCSRGLAPVQLAEAVHLLWTQRYLDPYGLWMIAKEAAARLQEFEPCDVVLLLEAVAGMCVADDTLCEDAVAAVRASRERYSDQQLSSVRAALARIGYTGAV